MINSLMSDVHAGIASEHNSGTQLILAYPGSTRISMITCMRKMKRVGPLERFAGVGCVELSGNGWLSE